MNNLYIIGAGSQAKLIIDIVNSSQSHKIMGILDDNEDLQTSVINGVEVVGKVEMQEPDAQYIIAIGNNLVREKIVKKLALPTSNYANIIDKTATIMSSASIGNGNIIMPYVLVESGVELGDFNLINSKVSVGHDSVIADFCSISSGSVLGGKVTMEKGSFVGLNSTINNRVTLKKNAIVAISTSVDKDVEENCLAYSERFKSLKLNSIEYAWKLLM